MLCLRVWAKWYSKSTELLWVKNDLACFLSTFQINPALHKYNFGVEVGNDCYTEEVIEISLKYVFGKLDFPSIVSMLEKIVLN